MIFIVVPLRNVLSFWPSWSVTWYKYGVAREGRCNRDGFQQKTTLVYSSLSLQCLTSDDMNPTIVKHVPNYLESFC
ncbi:hypothetical protein LguiA_005203 [Lonicera macranthoides]